MDDLDVFVRKNLTAKREREGFYSSFKAMAGGFCISYIGLFDLFCSFFFDLLYFWLFGLFDCQFILNLATFFIVFLYVSYKGFGKTKTSVQLNRLQKVIDRSTADGVLLASIFDGSSFDADGVLAANYGYFERYHEILWNGNLFDYYFQ